MDEKHSRFTKPFNIYKYGVLIDSFDYVPDCAFKLFGKNDSNISAVLKDRKKTYVFTYKVKLKKDIVNVLNMQLKIIVL
jgi:hypothetical protein